MPHAQKYCKRDIITDNKKIEMKIKNVFLYLCIALCSITVNAADSLEVRIKLKSVNDTLTFNQSFVPNNSMEYQWTILIDSDNNSATGNTVGYGGNTGFDVGLTVAHFKIGGATQTGSIVSINTQKNTVIFNGSSSMSANAIRAFIDYTDTSLVMRGATVFAELSNVAAGNRYFAYATYYSSTGIITDVSSVSTIPTMIADPLNDVPSSFIDMKELNINFVTTDISESYANDIAFNVFPNPSSGIFKIESSDVLNASLKVFNLLGEEVLHQQIGNEINLCNAPKGIYFVKMNVGQTLLTKEVVIW
jgi:hypothetical protein